MKIPVDLRESSPAQQKLLRLFWRNQGDRISSKESFTFPTIRWAGDWWSGDNYYPDRYTYLTAKQYIYKYIYPWHKKL